MKSSAASRIGLVRIVGLASVASLVTAGAGCGGVLKPPEPDRRLDVRVAGELFDSDSGYHFAALAEPSASVVRLDVRYPVGSADDPVGKAGLAHLVEHLLFDIEVVTPAGKTSIAAELGRIALYYNAETDLDHTSFEVVAAPSSLDELVKLEVDRVRIGCAGLPQAVFEREREIVIAELRERNGAGGAQLSRAIAEAVFPEGHPYRQAASVESVASLTYQDACGFIASAYRHGDVSVVASGAVDRATLQQAAAHHLARAPRRAGLLRVPPSPLSPRTGTVHLAADVSEPMIIATWPLPARASRDYRLLATVSDSIADYLGGYALEYQWGHDAYSSVIGGDYAPVLAVAVSLKARSDADEAIAAVGKAVDLTMRDMYRPGDDRDSVAWKLVWQAAAERDLALWESLAGRNAMVADAIEHHTPDDTLVHRIGELVAATPAHVHELGVSWFASDRMRVLVVEPSPTASFTSRRAPTLSGHAYGVHVDGALADRPVALPPLVAVPNPERYLTQSGLTVVLWPHGSTPLVHGRLVVDSGTAHDPVGVEGLASLMGASRVDSDSITFAQRELATRVDDLVRGLASQMGPGSIPISDLELAQLRKTLSRREVAELTQYEESFLVALYGEGHPYARLPISVASTKRISPDGASDWSHKHVVPNNSTLVIAGQFDSALVKKHIRYDSDHFAHGTDSPDIVAPVQPRRGFVAGVATKPTPSLELRVGFVAGRGLDEHAGMRLVLARVLALHLSRLRTDQALTYGAEVSYDPRRGGGVWSITASVDASRAAEATSSLVAALASMRDDPESYREELVLARQQVLETLLRAGGDSASMVDRLANLARFDLDDTSPNQVATGVAALTLAPFHAFVQEELSSSAQVFGAFGNAEPVEAALIAAGRDGAVTSGSDPSRSP